MKTYLSIGAAGMMLALAVLDVESNDWHLASSPIRHKPACAKSVAATVDAAVFRRSVDATHATAMLRFARILADLESALLTRARPVAARNRNSKICSLLSCLAKIEKLHRLWRL